MRSLGEGGRDEQRRRREGEGEKEEGGEEEKGEEEEEEEEGRIQSTELSLSRTQAASSFPIPQFAL